MSEQDDLLQTFPEKLSEKQETSDESVGVCLQMVVVAVQEMFYGIRISTVREILRMSKISWVPWTPEYIVGILNVRGEMLPVVDLRSFLHHGASSVTETSRIVVIESRDLVASVLVDAMFDIIDVPIATFTPRPGTSDYDEQEYLEGQFRWRDMTLDLIDSDCLLQGIVVNQG
jgi:purine-binding chemotaxis protein CheW